MKNFASGTTMNATQTNITAFCDFLDNLRTRQLLDTLQDMHPETRDYLVALYSKDAVVRMFLSEEDANWLNNRCAELKHDPDVALSRIGKPDELREMEQQTEHCRRQEFRRSVERSHYDGSTYEFERGYSIPYRGRDSDGEPLRDKKGKPFFNVYYNVGMEPQRRFSSVFNAPGTRNSTCIRWLYHRYLKEMNSKSSHIRETVNGKRRVFARTFWIRSRNANHAVTLFSSSW